MLADGSRPVTIVLGRSSTVRLTPSAMWDFRANENEGARFFDQIRVFIGLASECDNAGPHIEAYRNDIVEEAEAFVARGGLLLSL